MEKYPFSCLIFFALFYFLPNHVFSTVLEPGDIAIIGYNFRNPDEFSFLALTDIPEGSVIHFTDCGWSNDDGFRRNEGILTYVVPQGGLMIGEVVTYNAFHPDFSTEGVFEFFRLAMAGDQIFVYQGSFENPSFIYALNNN